MCTVHIRFIYIISTLSQVPTMQCLKTFGKRADRTPERLFIILSSEVEMVSVFGLIVSTRIESLSQSATINTFFNPSIKTKEDLLF